MERLIYVIGRCKECGKMSSRLVNASIADEDLAPVKCECNGQVEFSEMVVRHHLSDTDYGEAVQKRRGLLSIPSESVADINTLATVCLCFSAVSIFERYLDGLSQIQTVVIAMVVTLVIISYWLFGRAWFRACRDKEDRMLRVKFQQEGKFLRDLENRTKEVSRENTQSSES